MDTSLERKLSILRKRIRKLDGALVAFSGGVDSTFLMRICREELGEKAVAVTALSDSYPRSELSMARRVAKIIGVKHLVVDPKQPEGAEQPRPSEFCRGSNVYSCLKSMAMRMKLGNVLDGSHRDDASEKGRHFMAARRAGVRSPLLESDLTKAEIRLLAKELGLPNWDAPSSAERKKPAREPLRPSARRLALEYVRSIEPGAALIVRGGRVFISVSEASMGRLAKRITELQKRLRAMGFSEVLLKLSS
ncbi:MAG: 7-cyano-7-deazaguanine synthase [Candidatus Micrarchaeota archaeon]